MRGASYAGPAAALALLITLSPLLVGRQAHSWTPSLFALCAATPLAWAIAGRGGAGRALLGLLAGGLIAGPLAAAWAPSFGMRCEVPDALGWLARARSSGSPPAGGLALALLAIVSAGSQLLVRAPRPELGERVWRGLIGAMILLGALQPGLGRQNDHDRGWLLAACLAAGAAMGAAGGWAERRAPVPAVPAAAEGRRVWPWLLGLVGGWLVGAIWWLGCAAWYRPPVTVPDPEAARAALRAIQAGQAGRDQGFPASLTELAGVSSEVLTGVAHGYTFRYGEWGTGWAAAADPQAAGFPWLWVGPVGEVQGGAEPRPLLPP